jgi:AcrR family transcriptional regulator
MSSGATQVWALPEPGPAAGRYSARHLQVLGELETIVLTEGFRDLTVGGLADRLHCSRRTLYELAESKDALVLLVIDRVLRRVGRRAHEAAATGATHFDRLRAFLIEGIAEVHRATLSFSQDVADEPAAHDLVSEHFRVATGVVVQMLDDGIAAGEFAAAHPQVVAQVLDAGLARLQDPDVLRTAGVTFAEALEEFLSLLADGLRLPRSR